MATYKSSPVNYQLVGTHTDGVHTYENKDGQIYKNGNLVPEENYKYIPNAVGGTGDSTYNYSKLARVTKDNETGQNYYQKGNLSMDEGSYRKFVNDDPYMQAVASGGFTGGGHAGGFTQQPQVQDNSAQIKRMYGDILTQLKQAIAANKATNRSKIQTQINEAPDQYRNLRNAVSTDYYKGVSPLKEALANTGNLNSGMGRQEQLEATTGMMNGINTLNTQQQQYENELNNSILDLEKSSSIQETQAVSDNASKLTEALTNESNRVSDQSYSRLQDALTRSDKLSELGYERSQDAASSLGYTNPYAQYVITPDIQAQLAPYANDYAAFIRDNPGSWLTPYAQNARFQKMLSSGNTFTDELENYRSPEYQADQLKNALTQAQISSTNALANRRGTASGKEPSQTEVKNYVISSALQAMRNAGDQQSQNDWLYQHQTEIIQNGGIEAYNYLFNQLYPGAEAYNKAINSY